MKKIDLHIHTVPTVSDSEFTFSIEQLEKYVESKNIDAIAITNHNRFDRAQFNLIRDALCIKVFPGIEVDVEDGHLLVMTEESDLDDFERRCNKIFEMNGGRNNSTISEKTFIDVFPDFQKYLLIPHYDKTPKLELYKVPKLKEYITCGEVTSAKKFLSLKKTDENLVPVLFSDMRVSDNVFSDRQTFIDTDELSLTAIKYSLMDSSKVSLSPKDGHIIFKVLDNGLEISTGLTVILGKRSSGKTYTLDRINEQFEGAKYIKQFSLLSKEETAAQQRFEKLLQTKSSSVTEAFLAPFKEVVEDVKIIDIESDEQDIENYIQALLTAASEAERQDVFAKCRMFRETLYGEKKLSSLEDLINAVDILVKNVTYKNIIDKFIAKKELLHLAIALREQYIKEQIQNLKIHYINDIVKSIQQELRVHSTNTPVPDIDLYQVMLNREKIAKFEMIANAVKRERVIEERNLYSYKVVAKASPFTGAQSMKLLSHSKMAFSDAFSKYDQPYEFLKVLKNKEGLPVSEIYKYFVEISYEVLNEFGTKASGGERSEYNLLQDLVDAARCKIVLLDEPESSFDNLFLKDGVNVILKELSKQVPVVIATHNNTIGASLHPDYLVYTEKETLPGGNIKYRTFTGFPTSNELIDLEGKTISRRDVMLDCLEAGEPAYMDRRTSYEIFGN